MLRCLEEEQHQQKANQHNALSTRSTAQSSTSQLATQRLHAGYNSLLAAKLPPQPPTNFSSSILLEPPHSSTTGYGQPDTIDSMPVMHVEPQSSLTSIAPEPESPLAQEQIRSLNMATVELEHQKFLNELVIPFEKLKGMGPIEYWAVSSFLIQANNSDIQHLLNSSIRQNRLLCP